MPGVRAGSSGPPRVLLLMATRTYRAEAFLTAAAKLGVQVTVGSEREHLLASYVPGATVALDFAHPKRAAQQVVQFAQRYPLHAVVGVDDDTTILAAEAARALGLPHNAVESVRAARYKDLFRLVLDEAGLPGPSSFVASLDEPARDVAARAPYPCVVKPLALSASRGVIRADTPAQLVAAVQAIAAILADSALLPDDPARSQYLVESFIPGRECALEGLLVDGTLHVLALFDKPDPLDGPYFEETIYVTPSRLAAADQEAVRQAAQDAASALGLREGPVHAEVRLNSAGPYVIEVAPRTIGGQCSNVLRFDSGLALEELVLRQATRLDLPPLQRQGGADGVMMIPIPRGGTLHGWSGVEAAEAVPGVEKVTIAIPCGERVVPLPHGDRYLGFIFTHAPTPAQAEAALRRAHACLRFDIREDAPPSS